jgi:ABC-2 type transport system ATP-binding protein
MDDSGSVIEAQKLGKNFGSVQAVKSVSFAVCKGEIFGFFGPNGAGKTTTIRLLCGLTKPTSGSATVYGHYIMHDSTGVRRHLAITPERAFFMRR